MEPRAIIERSQERMAVVDLESKLLQSRQIFITGEINEETVATYQAELIYLTGQIIGDKTKSPIKVYINSPGGECYSLLGLYDVMRTFIDQGYVIQTKVIGLAASCAAVILLSGTEGYRSASPNSRIMIHQPSSGVWGTATDMKITVEEVEKIKSIISNIIKERTGNDLSDLMERDKWLSPEEALKLGIIDKIS